jgi:hypothetical protein
MAMSPFALTMLGMDSAQRRRPGGDSEGEVTMRPTRSARRATSHYNYFLTQCVPAEDEPPTYARASKHKVSSILP